MWNTYNIFYKTLKNTFFHFSLFDLVEQIAQYPIYFLLPDKENPIYHQFSAHNSICYRMLVDLALQQREIQMSFRDQEIAFSAPLRVVKAFAAFKRILSRSSAIRNPSGAQSCK